MRSVKNPKKQVLLKNDIKAKNDCIHFSSLRRRYKTIPEYI